MLTLFHSPNSRSTTVVAALEEMGVRDKVDIRLVTVARVDGTGGRDKANPHPEGKVPYLEHDGHGFSERAAILAYLAELFPEAGMGRVPGEAERGPFLGWLAWYAGVMEPALIAHHAGIRHPWLEAAIRDNAAVEKRLTDALADGREYLLEGGFTVADLLVYGPYNFFPDSLPADPKVQAWGKRVAARPGMAAAVAFDQLAVAKLAA